MKWNLNERRRVTKELILKFRSYVILKNIFLIINKIFFISPGDLYLLFTMNFHVFLRTSKAARFQFKDSKISWNILSLSNVVYVDKKEGDQYDGNCRNNILFLVLDPRIYVLIVDILILLNCSGRGFFSLSLFFIVFHDIDNVYNDIKSDEEETKEVKKKKKMCKNEI